MGTGQCGSSNAIECGVQCGTVPKHNEKMTQEMFEKDEDHDVRYEVRANCHPEAGHCLRQLAPRSFP